MIDHIYKIYICYIYMNLCSEKEENNYLLVFNSVNTNASWI